ILGFNLHTILQYPLFPVVDVRINNRSVASALNADGWFSIWVLNPLTYPPQTPANQYIVLMASAGSDFSYRLPVTPPYVQNGVHENAEKGTTEDTDATQTSGHAIGLDMKHSNCSFFFDRYRLVGMLDSVWKNKRQVVSVFGEDGIVKAFGELYQSGVNPKHYLTLGPNPSISTTLLSAYVSLDHTSSTSAGNHYFCQVTNGDPFFLRSCPFTYFHADLEVTVRPAAPVTGMWYVTWFPPGSNLEEHHISPSFYATGSEASTKDLVLNNDDLSYLYSCFPCFHSSGSNCVSFIYLIPHLCLFCRP
ncbi:capsid protein VP1, partial [cosavirus D3]